MQQIARTMGLLSLLAALLSAYAPNARAADDRNNSQQVAATDGCCADCDCCKDCDCCQKGKCDCCKDGKCACCDCCGDGGCSQGSYQTGQSQQGTCCESGCCEGGCDGEKPENR